MFMFFRDYAIGTLTIQAILNVSASRSPQIFKEFLEFPSIDTFKRVCVIQAPTFQARRFRPYQCLKCGNFRPLPGHIRPTPGRFRHNFFFITIVQSGPQARYGARR